MSRWKEIMIRPLRPGRIGTLLIPTVGFGILGMVAYFGWMDTPLAYVSYVLAFYGLTVMVAGCMPLIRKGIEFYRERKAEFMPDVRKSLLLSLSINICYGGFNLISGAVYQSVWVISTGAYYLILSLIRIVLVCYEIKQARTEESQVKWKIGWQGFQTCGVLMLLLNVTMSGMVVQMIWYGQGSRYPEILVYAVAVYTFYRLTAAVIRVVKSKGRSDPIDGAARNISLTAAIMALYSLQTAMLDVFADDPEYRLMMNNLSGSAVCLVVVLGALGMVVYGERRKKEVYA